MLDASRTAPIQPDPDLNEALRLLAACRTLVVDSEKRPRRAHFLSDSRPHGCSMGQEAGEKRAVAVVSQPTIPKSDRLLGKPDFLPAVHEGCFSGMEGEDGGRGSPYGAGAVALARFARAFGFTGPRQGPRGRTAPVHSSPCDGILFSRNFLSLSLAALARDAAWGGLVAGALGRLCVSGKALRELRHELQCRPRWLAIPRKGLMELTENAS